jgi:hypothetical protein
MESPVYRQWYDHLRHRDGQRQRKLGYLLFLRGSMLFSPPGQHVHFEGEE